ncbi:hypothetical protein MTO96_019982 [Rhipicephalus appendiculatus]
MVHHFFYGGWAVFQFAAGRRQHLQTVGADGAARGCCPAGAGLAVVLCGSACCVGSCSCGCLLCSCSCERLGTQAQFCECFKQLDAEARQRYRQKLMFEGQELPDPTFGSRNVGPIHLDALMCRECKRPHFILHPGTIQDPRREAIARDGRSARNTAKFGYFSAVRRPKRTQTEENTGKPEAVLGRAAAASGDTAVADPGG